MSKSNSAGVAPAPLKAPRPSDADLIAAFAAGDNKAFDVLLSRHQERLFAYIKGLVGDEHLANDIFQETFIKVITTIRNGGYVDTGKFSPWLMRIAHNAFIDHFRHEKPDLTVSTDNDDCLLLNDMRYSEKSIEDTIMHGQWHREIAALIDDLPEPQQQVVRLRFYNELTFKEIAEQLGISINTALGRMRYALANLRRAAATRGVTLPE